jgi:predicted nucleotidyltransferase
MTKRTHIEIPKEEIEGFCKKHHIRKLSLFGSALRDDFTPESDLDKYCREK